MSKKQFQVTLADPKAKGSELIQAIPGAGAEPVRIKAQPNANYLLTDKSTGRAPQQIHARRKNKDLLIQLEDYRADGNPDLIVENFYEMASGSFAGVAEDSVTYPFVPNTAQESHQFAGLNEGGQIAHVLGSVPVTTAAASPLVAAAGFAGLGGIAAAGAGALGLAALAGGGGSKSSPAGTTPGGSKLAVKAGKTNLAELEGLADDGKPKVQGSKQDGILNTAEAQAGLKATIQFNESPSKPLAAEHLTLSPEGSTIRKDSFIWDTASNTASFIIDPPANASGEVGVRFSDAGKQLTDQAGNALAAGDWVINPQKFDTQALAVKSWSSNIDELERGVTGGKAAVTGAKDDDVLNTAEAREGLRISVQFNEAPSAPLVEGHFALSAGTIRKDSFIWDPASNTASFFIDPPANTSGKLDVSFSDQGKALTDRAGNTFTGTQWSLNYDLLAPSLIVDGTDGGSQPWRISSASTGLLVNYTQRGDDLDQAKSWISMFGKQLDDLQGAAPTLNTEVLGKLVNNEGFYTLSFHLEDAHANQSIVHQVLKVDPGIDTVIDRWSAGKETQEGTDDRDYFIDRAGSHKYNAASLGSDQFVWLKAFANTNAKADVDVIQKFDATGLGGVVGDVINLRDLLGGNPVNQDDLSKFLQAGQVKNASTTDTYLYINALGQLDTSANTTHEKLMNTSTQVIVLEGIDKNLDALIGNNNLYWQPLL